MTSEGNASGSLSIGQQVLSDKKAAEDEKNAPKVSGDTRKKRRTRDAAFVDDECTSAESPPRKKKNATTSTTDKASFEEVGNNSRPSVENDVQAPANHLQRNFNSDHINSAVDSINTSSRELPENADGNTFDLVPPTNTTQVQPTATTNSRKIIGTDAIEIETKTQGPSKAEYDNLTNVNPNGTHTDHLSTKEIDSQNSSIRNKSEHLRWVGIFIFLVLFVLSEIVWSGFLLNQSATYQLKSMNCRNQLQQAYQMMDLRFGFDATMDPTDENNISDRFEENDFYWKELEAQVQYWKKEAKKYKRYGDGFREQCQKDLLELLPESDS